MKVLILSREYPPIIVGGAGIVARNLAEEWINLGHQVDVVSARVKNAPKFEIINGVRVYRVPIFSRTNQTTPSSAVFYITFGFLKSLQLFLENRYDLINAHFAILAGPIGAILSKLFKVPNILTIVGGDIYEPTKKLSPHNNFFLKPLVRWVLNNSTKIVAISSNTKENAEKYYNPAKKIRVIPVGFKTPQFDKINRNELGLGADKIYLISVGRLAVRKNFDTLLNAFSKIQSESVELLLIGDGPESEKLKKTTKKLGINDKVHFLGAVSEEKKYQYLSVADIFVLPSLHEGFGIVFQEAMYCGLPIIAGNNGGQTDFLKNEENALLVNAIDSENITNAIEKLIGDDNLRAKLAQNAKRDSGKFDANNIAGEYIKLIQ